MHWALISLLSFLIEKEQQRKQCTNSTKYDARKVISLKLYHKKHSEEKNSVTEKECHNIQTKKIKTNRYNIQTQMKLVIEWEENSFGILWLVCGIFFRPNFLFWILISSVRHCTSTLNLVKMALSPYKQNTRTRHVHGGQRQSIFSTPPESPPPAPSRFAAWVI